jgi:hypothetical protein
LSGVARRLATRRIESEKGRGVAGLGDPSLQVWIASGGIAQLRGFGLGQFSEDVPDGDVFDGLIHDLEFPACGASLRAGGYVRTTVLAVENDACFELAAGSAFSRDARGELFRMRKNRFPVRNGKNLLHPKVNRWRNAASNAMTPPPSTAPCRSFLTGALGEIERLDAVRNHQRIAFLSARCDFPFDTTRSLEFALLRTFGVPSVAGLLDRTGEFVQRTQRRYDDTDIIVSEMMEHGYDSERGARALQRMNEIHGRFKIANADFLYVLSTFVFEPIRWNARFGWRRMCEKERIAQFQFWREVGLRMHISDIPLEYDEFERFNREYESTQFRFTEGGRRIALATIGMFAGWFPWPIRKVVPVVMRAMIDERLLTALGLPAAPRWVIRAVELALRWRGRVAHIFTWRRGAVLRTRMVQRSYPCGYKMEQLGPVADGGN